MHHSKAGWRKTTPAQVSVPTVSETAKRLIAQLDQVRNSMDVHSEREFKASMVLADTTDELEALLKDEEILEV